MTDNLAIYEAVRKPDANALKPFDNGKFKGTDINTMWRIKTLTQHFGPCGIGWYYTIDRKWTETAQDDTVMAFADISLYVKLDGEWSKPIAGTGGNRQAYKTKAGYVTVSDECYKMAVTDAFGNACRSLGFGADVYWDNDVTKYTRDKPAAPEPEQRDKLLAEYRRKVMLLTGCEAKDVAEYFQKKHGKNLYEVSASALTAAIASVDKKIAEADPTT